MLNFITATLIMMVPHNGGTIDLHARVFPYAADRIHVRIYEDGSGRVSWRAKFPGHRPARVGCSTGVPW